MQLARRDPILLIFAISIIFLNFTFLHYPSVDDFTFGGLKYVESIDFAGSIDIFSNNTPGYYVYNYIIWKICNIPAQDTVMLPFQILPITLLLMLILRRTNAKNIICCSILLIYFTSDYAPISTWFVHTMGFILFLTLIAISTMKVKSISRKKRRQYDIALIIVILALNFTSYKLTFISIVFMILLQIGMIYSASYCKHDHPGKSIKSGAHCDIKIIIFALIFVSFFNHFIYDTFLPVLNAYSDFSTSSGFEKTFFTRSQELGDPLWEYYFQSPGHLIQLHTIWLGLLMGGLGYFAMKVMRKVVKRASFSFEENLILAIFGASTLMYMIYNLLGLSDMQFLILSGFIAYAQIFGSIGHDKKKVIGVTILVFLLLNASIGYERIKYDYSSAQRDSNSFEYLNVPSTWIAKNLIVEPIATRTVTDTLTYTYASYKAERVFESEFYKKFQILTRDDIMALLGQAEDSNRYFSHLVTNHNLNRFQILGWETFKSEQVYKDLDNGVPDLVYTSGSIRVYHT